MHKRRIREPSCPRFLRLSLEQKPILTATESCTKCSVNAFEFLHRSWVIRFHRGRTQDAFLWAKAIAGLDSFTAKAFLVGTASNQHDSIITRNSALGAGFIRIRRSGHRDFWL